MRVYNRTLLKIHFCHLNFHRSWNSTNRSFLGIFFGHWNKISNNYILKKENFISSHCFNLWLADCKAEVAFQKHMANKKLLMSESMIENSSQRGRYRLLGHTSSGMSLPSRLHLLIAHLFSRFSVS